MIYSFNNYDIFSRAVLCSTRNSMNTNDVNLNIILRKNILMSGNFVLRNENFEICYGYKFGGYNSIKTDLSALKLYNVYDLNVFRSQSTSSRYLQQIYHT